MFRFTSTAAITGVSTAVAAGEMTEMITGGPPAAITIRTILIGPTTDIMPVIMCGTTSRTGRLCGTIKIPRITRIPCMCTDRSVITKFLSAPTRPET